MDIHFDDAKQNASAATLWEVITDFARHPSFDT
jgi:hypothetical protein